jgi:RimJ/RimL family protein N-acetyltransferase
VFREAADLYVNFLFERWRIPTVKGRTLARNHRGLGAMRKLGATIVNQQLNNGEQEFVWELRISDRRLQISE